MKRKKVFVFLVIFMFLVLPVTVVGKPVNQSIATVLISPSEIIGPPPDVGDTFKIYINIENVLDLYGYSVGLKWNPEILSCSSFTYNWTFIPPPPDTLTVSGTINNVAGKVYPPYSASLITDYGVSGNGTLFQAEFLVKAYGETSIELDSVDLLDYPDEKHIPFNMINCTFKLSLPYGPTAVKTHTPSNPQVNEPVTFDASGSLPGWNGTHDVPIASYRWDFGDGNITTVATPIIYHTYTAANTYTVALTVTCEDDPVLIAQGLTSDSVSQDITVYSAPAPPKASFTYSPPSPQVNTLITFDASTSEPGFNGTSDVPIANYTWDFDDGNTTTVTNPTIYHAYSVDGTYTVNLTVTCQDDPVLIAQGLMSDSAWQEITVYEVTPPIIGTPTQNPTEVMPEQTVTVSVNVTDNVGVQTVILSYSGDIGATWTNVTMTKTTGDTYEGQIPGFPAGTHIQYKIIAYDTSNNVAVEDNAGAYYVYTVISPPYGPTAVKTHMPSAPKAGETVTFGASGSLPGWNGTHDVPIASYTWDFDDGNITTVTNPTIYHVYSVDGTYTVNLTVTCQDDPVLIAQGLMSDSIWQEITVYEVTPPNIGDVTQNPEPSVVMSDVAVTVSVNVTDNVAVQSVILSYSNDTGATWYNVTMSNTVGDTYEGDIPGFPAGTNIQYKIIAYDTSNNVAVEDNAGAYYVYVVISPPYGPTAVKTHMPSAPKAGETVTFDASGSLPGWNGTHDVPIASYRWDFGDGNTTTVTVPIIYHTYTAIDTYTVNLTVTCEDDPVLIGLGLTANSTWQLITIYSPLVPPMVRFSYSPSFPSVNATVTFNASDSTPEGGTIVSYTWDFGDGNITTVVDPIIYHVYSVDGAYTVVLNVTDSQGLWNTSSKGITIAAPKRPLINPAEGQYANYLIYYYYNMPDQVFIVGGWNFTYDHYISPDLINVTFWYNYMPAQPAGQFDPTALMVVDITNREVVSGYWAGTWFIDWIETNITLGSTINLYNGIATVVGSQIINFNGYPVECWKLLQEPTGDRYWYDKFSGLLLRLEILGGSYFNIMLVDTNIHLRAVYPIASFTYSPADPFVTEPAAFDASSSYDPDGNIVSYTWDFGDGNITTVSDPVVYHRYADAGDYNVTLTVSDDDGLTAVTTATVTVKRIEEVNVVVDVGSIHFRCEMAEFYILVSCLGMPVDANLSALLYYDGALHADLSSSVEHVAAGLYRVPYTIPSDASAGTYVLVVEASYFTLSGASMKAFLLSSTLTNWNAWLIEIQGDVATIRTDIATFQTSLDAINAKLQSIEGKIVIIETDIGTIKVNADLINATVTAIDGRIAKIESSLGDIEVSVLDVNATISSFEGSFVKIETDLGNINTTIASINLTVTSIDGKTVTLSTSLGDLQGIIEDIQGDIVTIKTDLGKVLVDVADVKDKLPPTPTTTLDISVGSILSAIAAIFAIAAVFLLLKRRRTPTL